MPLLSKSQHRVRLSLIWESPRVRSKGHWYNKPTAQLTLYALALTRLAGLRLFDIKCAWFNEDEYCEFFPRSLIAGH